MKRMVFEGFCDHESGWEFDMPIIVVKPFIYCSHGSDIEGIREILEHIADQIVGGKKFKSETKTWPYTASTIRRYLRLSKAGKPTRNMAGVAYFAVTMDLDVEGGWEAVTSDDGQPWRYVSAVGNEYLRDVFDCKCTIRPG